MGYDAKDFLKQKVLQEKVRTAGTPGLSGLSALFDSWILPARNVSSLAFIQLCETLSKP